jgi:hypothetical protein
MLKNEQGQWVEDVEKAQDMANDFYKKIFSNDQISREWRQTYVTYPVLESDLLSKLDSPINNDEVKKVVFSMYPWKAPGPDGFSVGFYQKSWDIVGGSVCNFVCDVWHKPISVSFQKSSTLSL